MEDALAAGRELTPWIIFSALRVASYVFVWFLVPESKGHSLEEIHERWVERGDCRLEEGPV